MIRELADYEHELDAVEATEASLDATIAFAPDGVESSAAAPNTEPTTPARPSRCLILFNENDEPSGIALYFYNYSTWRAKAGIYRKLHIPRISRRRGKANVSLVQLRISLYAPQRGRRAMARDC